MNEEDCFQKFTSPRKGRKDVDITACKIGQGFMVHRLESECCKSESLDTERQLSKSD
jgi:hypothetical protein